MPKKTHGLARGLDILLPDSDLTASGGAQDISVGDIDPNPDQPRRTFSEASPSLRSRSASRGCFSRFLSCR